MSRVYLLDHPLIQHKLGLIRQAGTGCKEFRELVEEVTMLMAYEVTWDLPLADREVQTPVGPAKTKCLAGREMAVVPVLRAGLGMLGGLLKLVPTACVGHIGLYRDPESLQPVQYYCKLPPDLAEREVLVLEPVLATGGSAAAALRLLKEHGAEKVKLLCLVAAPGGIDCLQEEHPDVDIFTTAIDEGLNGHGYIVPGLGDAGDRLFGT